MYLSIADLVVVAVIGCAGVYYFSGIRVRELAIEAVRRASRDIGFQLLDQSVAIERVSMSRDRQGRWRIWRQYRFDYSYDGLDRREGRIVMLGQRQKALLIAEPDDSQGDAGRGDRVLH